MKDRKMQKIVIVGGGSSGWMTAAYLSRALPGLQIILVESSDIPTIGVGEATITTISGFLSFLDMKEKDWMPACNGSYKYGIRFNDWFEVGEHYWHPFETLPYLNSQRHVGQYWYLKYLNQKPRDRNSLYSDCFLGVILNRENRILKTADGPEFAHTYPLVDGGRQMQLRVPYAYHFDAGLFGDYLKKRFRGPDAVEQIVDDVTAVNLSENGAIESLDTKGGLRIEGDLYVDCTGFRSALLDKALKEPFDSYSDTLFVDRAIAMRVPYEDPEKELRPYTTTTAKSSGWIWNIPVTERIGTGYVYCSSFASPDEAERDLRAHLGEKRVENLESRNFDIGRVGKHRNTWVKNCVAIGLSSGFLEPIESTSLHFVYAGAAKLAEALADGYYNAGSRAAYNSFITRMMEEARDFIAAHYALTKREDTPFWEEVKYHTRIPESLADYLDKARRALPNGPTNQVIFQESSWVCVLVGMNFLPNTAAYANINQQEAAQQFRFMQQMQSLQTSLKESSVSHYEYLKTTGAAG